MKLKQQPSSSVPQFCSLTDSSGTPRDEELLTNTLPTKSSSLSIAATPHGSRTAQGPLAELVQICYEGDAQKAR